jgi:alanyl-tRNA synthetase
MNSTEIREAFLKFFESRGHRRVPSDSLLPSNDPTLLFTSAGMVQFKPLYVAKDKPYTRATSCQRCLRTTDIDQVGVTGRHHTFFEMLGNFSFGDYFKEGAIEYAWEFLTDTMRIDKSRLFVTVFEKDDEAARMWERFVPQGRIVRFGDEDNYWPAGSVLPTWTGPNGPCSELYYDFGEKHCPFTPKCSRPGVHECERYREIWNLVFPQFMRNVSGENPPMAKPGIDTGMGFERMAVVMQDKGSNYETDLFAPLMHKTAELLRLERSPRTAKEKERAQRIASDHARAAAFMVSDGMIPSNEGRGYVLRRIIRRAVRQTAAFGDAFPIVSKLVGEVAATLGGAYPEIAERAVAVAATIEIEENRFIETLERGLAELDKEKGTGRDTLDGARAFYFHDTFGFPRELTRDIWVREMNRTLSPDFEREYKSALEEQQERARAAWKGSGAKALTSVHHELAGELGATPFVGYGSLAAATKIAAIIRTAEGGEGVRTAQAKEGDIVGLVLERTPFYAESGGQLADLGVITSDRGRAEVLDVVKPVGGMFIHMIRVKSGELKAGDEVRAEVDAERRKATARHHTATHLLHAALREVMGPGVAQAGSLVAPDRLRFDFTSQKAVEKEKLRTIEAMVNAKVIENLPVVTHETSLADAKKLGAMALFGEKYGDRVRMVEVADYSRELCGGTHVTATGTIGPVVIVSEGAVAAGVRRIEALAGAAALDALAERRDSLERTAALLKVPPVDVEARVTRMIAERRELETALKAARESGAKQALAGRTNEAETVGGVKVLIAETDTGGDSAALRSIADQALDRLGEGIVVLGTRSGEKCQLVVRVSAGLTGRVGAGDVVKAAVSAEGGSGGGRPDMAQGGLKDPARLPAALENARGFLGKKLAGG